ncbi:MAG: arylsulfatase [bacterium]|nr:arylsulfatase [bacterium]
MAKPNVIFVLTDDQGYADLGCTGNPWLRTPSIDRFHNEAVRLTDFHVSPLCTPTRGALMTGHRPVRNGAWATCWGRSILRQDETTLGDIFTQNGYHTGYFGKWHLGDNYPYRPQDRGFQTVVAHKGGGVGQTPDFWGNNYFNDTYFHNGTPVAHTGYCTDIWFEEAEKFIASCNGEPFFAFISTNAPHSPYLVADKYKEPYKNNPDIPEPAFYGMIENIDENFGHLRNKLQELNIEENTLLIFMTDNGSSGGCTLDKNGFLTRGYNAGMRGKKASYYDGGHRAPFFLQWPAAGLTGDRDINELSLHIDVLPTLIDLCNLNAPDLAFDGTSLGPLLRGEQTQLSGDRVHFLQYRQNTNPPEKWTSAVLTRQWRLIAGAELYDIKSDPEQRLDVSAEHPEVVSHLREAHERWWDEISPNFDHYCPIALGHDAENPTRLNSMDVMGDVAWNQGHIVEAQKSTGRWAVEITHPGTYRFSLRRWPEELDLPIEAALTPEEASQIAPYQGKIPECRTIEPVCAQLKLFDLEYTCNVHSGNREITFNLSLERTGETHLEAWFINSEGEACGAYYVTVERLTKPLDSGITGIVPPARIRKQTP